MAGSSAKSPFGAEAPPLEIVEGLCRRLERGAVAGDTVAGWLGEGAGRSADVLRLRPRVSVFQEVSVQAPSAEGGVAEAVTLVLAAPGAVALGELEARWGEGTEAPLLHPGDPFRVGFYPDAPEGSPFECAVFAVVEGDDVQTGKVVALEIRVDPV